MGTLPRSVIFIAIAIIGGQQRLQDLVCALFHCPIPIPVPVLAVARFFVCSQETGVDDGLEELEGRVSHEAGQSSQDALYSALYEGGQYRHSSFPTIIITITIIVTITGVIGQDKERQVDEGATQVFHAS